VSSYPDRPATQPPRPPDDASRPNHGRNEPPADEEALREEIRDTREHLGATVDELSDRIVTQGQRAAVPVAIVGALIISAMIAITVLRNRRRPAYRRSRPDRRRRKR
jgi:sensor c-di-GMP phosphodiesterase-like protein